MENIVQESLNDLVILIVDDSHENIDVLSGLLSGYEKKIAINGKIALKLANTLPKPDLILLDIMMPDMNGYEVCEVLKKDPSTSDIPVIFISAMSDIKDLVKGFEVGSVDYITKPFNAEEVLRRVETHLTLSLYRKKLENINTILEEKVRLRTTELEVAKDKAEESSRLKSHFLSLMSHELRTPMAGIMGFSEILNDELGDNELGNLAEHLLDSSNRLNATLESILNLSIIESNKQSLVIEEFDLIKRVDELLDSHKMNAKIKGLEIKTNFKFENLPTYLDSTKFNIIFNNIVGNAIKYTKTGYIEIFVNSGKNGAIKNNIITVQDTGIGIPKDSYESIFEEFRQVYEGMNRNFEGVGLGLSLVKKYVTILKGKLELESEVGKGSKFTITLPCYSSFENFTTQKLGKRYIDYSQLPEKKINLLLVEDDFTNNKVNTMFLQDFCKITVATTGNEALIAAHKNNFDCILMDINLGKGYSGSEVTKILREKEKYKKTPIIAYTAYALDGDKENFLKVGCSHYISKPANKKTIREVILGSIK